MGTPTVRSVEVRAALLRWHGLPGQRERRRWSQRGRATGRPRFRLRQRGPLRRATGSGVSGNGGRFAGQPGRGGTVIGKPIWRRGGNGAGQPADRVSNSGDGGRATGRRRRGGSCRRVRPEVEVEGSRTGFARSTGRKRASPAGTPSGGNDGRCDRSRRRLTPEDRPVVDRSTFWGPGWVRRRKPAAPPGASLVPASIDPTVDIVGHAREPVGHDREPRELTRLARRPNSVRSRLQALSNVPVNSPRSLGIYRCSQLARRQKGTMFGSSRPNNGSATRRRKVPE